MTFGETNLYECNGSTPRENNIDIRYSDYPGKKRECITMFHLLLAKHLAQLYKP